MSQETVRAQRKKIKKADFLVAAPWSGSGKTLISCGLMRLFVRNGCHVRAFKCGPDYIDPMFHEKVVGVPSRNLDTFFSDAEQIRQLYARGDGEETITVIEGVMGLYDGLGGTREEGSAYHLAQTLDIPILLVLDAHGMGRTLEALLAGILQYDTDRRIVGVVLNRTSASYGKTIAPFIERDLGLPVLGTFPENKEMHLESRHLGLKLPKEKEDLGKQLDEAADILEKQVDFERFWTILDDYDREKVSGRDLSGSEERSQRQDAGTGDQEDCCENTLQTVRIAIAQDEAFCFYYEDNLHLLREVGAELVPFSPLRDHAIPGGCSGLLLGGGYPELFLAQLSANTSMRESIRRAIEGGMPSVAECGGFLYLHDWIENEEGENCPMVGVIHAGAQNTGKLVRFGYITVTAEDSAFLPAGSMIKGHEFHYYDSGDNGDGCLACKPVTQKSWHCVHIGETHWWGFPHLYYPSNPAFAEIFVQKCRLYAEEEAKRTPNSYRFFANRECKYYPCHKGLADFNCLFCYCPLYNREHCPGNPRYKEKDGRTIKVCTDCTFPHRADNYDVIIKHIIINNA